MLHEPLKRAGRITKPRGHSVPLEQAKWCAKGNFWVICLSNWHLIVTTVQVQGGKPAGTWQHIQGLLSARQRKGIFPKLRHSSQQSGGKAATKQQTKQQRSADRDFSYVTRIVQPNGCISSFGRIGYIHMVVREGETHVATSIYHRNLTGPAHTKQGTSAQPLCREPKPPDWK